MPVCRCEPRLATSIEAIFSFFADGEFDVSSVVPTVQECSVDHGLPSSSVQRTSNALGAGLLFIGAAEIAALATALATLLPQQSVGERRTTVRAWLVAVIGAIAAEPPAIATTPGALDLAALWRRACAEQTGGDQVPLVSWVTLSAIAERLTPVFDATGLGALEQSRRVDCAEGWVSEMLERLCAAPLPLAMGVQQLDAPALLQARLEELIGEERRRGTPPAGWRS
jgi:hypothetical protein